MAGWIDGHGVRALVLLADPQADVAVRRVHERVETVEKVDVRAGDASAGDRHQRRLRVRGVEVVDGGEIVAAVGLERLDSRLGASARQRKGIADRVSGAVEPPRHRLLRVR